MENKLVFNIKTMKKTVYLYLFLFIVAFLFQGCFDVKREIKFYPNGSGTEKITVTLDRSLFNLFPSYVLADNTGRAKKLSGIINDDTQLYKWLTASMQRSAGTQVTNLLVTDKSDESKEIIIEYMFDEPGSLLKVMKETTFDFSNQLNVSFSTLKFFLEDEDLTFKHVIRNANRSFDDSLALNIFSGLIQSNIVYYSIEFPFEILTSNAQSQAEKVLNWQFPLSNALLNQVEMTTEMRRPAGLDLPYAEKIDKTIEQVSKNKNPLIRIQVYNGNKEPVKIGTGIIVGDNQLVTNFNLMNLIEGQGYFSVILSNDSLAGIDDMQEKDLAPNWDLVQLRFNNNEKVKPLKYALGDEKYGDKVRIFYFPNTLSSFVYSMDATVTGTKKWNKMSIIEVKPAKPLSVDGGGVFSDNGEFIGMLTQAYSGEVGKLYVIPGVYIKTFIKK